MKTMQLIGVAMLLLLMAGGCARYEHWLTEPPDLARQIGREDVHVRLEPLDYMLRTVDNRLVMWIYNQTEDPITLLGAESTVVAPTGQSHPLLTQTIAPGSFIKLIFPPMRPQVARAGPAVGVGVGVGHGRVRPGMGVGVGGGRHAVYHPGDALHWEWRGETKVRMILKFLRGEEIFRHEFAFQRQRA